MKFILFCAAFSILGTASAQLTQLNCNNISFDVVNRIFKDNENAIRNTVSKRLNEYSSGQIKSSSKLLQPIPSFKIIVEKKSNGVFSFKQNILDYKVVERTNYHTNIYFTLQLIDTVKIMRGEYGNKLIDFILPDFTKNASKIFFLVLLEEDRDLGNIIGFCDSNNLKFLTVEGNIYTDIVKLIDEKYGSYEKYKELLADEEISKRLWQKSGLLENKPLPKMAEIATGIIKRSWRYNSLNNPSDTLHNISAMISALEYATTVSLSQKKILEHKIYSILSFVNGANLNLKDRGSFVLYFFDMKPIFASVLTTSQMHLAEVYFDTMLKIETLAEDLSKK